MGVPWTLQKVLAKDILQTGMASLRTFLTDFKKQKKKAAFLYGPSGTGKTSAVHALAQELNLEILELNASDVRNADGIQRKLGVASQQMSLFSKGKVILVDEVDGLAGNNDRGGAPAIASLIADSKFPIVLTANDPWESKLSSVRSKSLMIEFPAYDYLAMAEIMKRLCAREGVTVDESVLKTLARRSGGDLRAALTDLQTISISKTITKEHLSILGDRDREDSMHNALLKVFKNSDPTIAITAFEHISEDLDGAFLWVDENLPKEYTNVHDRARAYEALARADVYRGRIKRRQHWHFLTSVNALLSAGVAVAKDQKYPGVVTYTQTTRILKIWQANMKHQKRKAIAEKLAPLMHSSMKRAIRELPFLQVLFKKNTDSSKAIAAAAELDPEEVAWLAR